MTILLDQFTTRQEPYILVSQFSHNETVAKHSHEFYEFVYVESGFSVHNLNDYVTILMPGDIFGIRPGDFHGYFNVRHSKIYNCLFHKEALGSFDVKISQLPGISAIFADEFPKQREQKKVHLNITDRQEIAGLLYNMQKECSNNLCGSDLKLKAHLIEFLVLMSRSFESMKDVNSCVEYSKTMGILSAMEYIENNYSKRITIEGLATRVGLGVDYFTKTFKALCGLTPSDYLKLLRISKGYELLLGTALSISEISTAVGIEDPNYYSRIFKKTMGFSPLAFRMREVNGRSIT